MRTLTEGGQSRGLVGEINLLLNFLQSTEMSFRTVTGYIESPYILGSISPDLIFEDYPNDVPSSLDSLASLLNSVGLIFMLDVPYRLKGLCATHTWQIRISGWGRHYLDNCSEPRASDKVHSLMLESRRYYIELASIYYSGPLTTQGIDAARSINSIVPVPLSM